MAVIALAGITVAGCATRESPRYYTLNMQPSGAVPAVAYTIRVDRLRPAPALIRRNILVKPSATQVEYYALDEWAAGVADLVPEKLEAEFPPADADRAVLLLSGTILAFEQVDTSDGADAYIKLDLTVRPEDDRHGAPLLRRVYESRIPLIAPRPDTLVETLSEGMEHIAAALAHDLHELDWTP